MFSRRQHRQRHPGLHTGGRKQGEGESGELARRHAQAHETA